MRQLRPWGWLIAYVAIIYASLPFTGGIAQALDASESGRVVLAVMPLLAAGALVPVAVYLGYGRGLRWPVVLVAIALYSVVWFGLCQRLSEGVHLPQYGFMSLLALRALEGVVPGWGAYVGSVVLTILVSWGGESIQATLPDRVYDLRDVMLDAISAVLAMGITWFLARGDLSTGAKEES